MPNYHLKSVFTDAVSLPSGFELREKYELTGLRFLTGAGLVYASSGYNACMRIAF